MFYNRSPRSGAKIGFLICLLLSCLQLACDWPQSQPAATPPAPGQRHHQHHQHADFTETGDTGTRPALPPDQIINPNNDRKDNSGDQLPPDVLNRLGSIRLRHAGSVSGLLFAPGSQILISGGDDRTISWWNLGTGEEIRRIPAWQQIDRFVPLPGGEYFAAVDRYEPVYLIRRVSDGKLHQRLIGSSPNRRTAFACSADGRWYATPSASDTVQIWSAASAMPLTKLSGLASPAAILVFSPDSLTLTARAENGNFARWRTSDWDLLITGSQPFKGPVSMAADGSTMAVKDGWQTVLRDPTTFAEIRRVKSATNLTAFAADGKNMAIARHNSIDICETFTEREISAISEQIMPVKEMAFSGDGQLLATGDYLGSIRVFDTRTGRGLLPIAGHKGNIRSICFSASPDRLFSVDSNGEVKLWEITAGISLQTWQIASAALLIKELSPGRVLLVANDRLITFSGENGTILADTGAGSHTSGYFQCPAAVSADRTRAATLFKLSSQSADDKTTQGIKIWNVAEMKVIATFTAPIRTGGLALSADGSLLAVTSTGEGQQLVCYGVDTGKERFRLDIPTTMTYISVPFFTPDGNLIVGGGSYTPKGHAYLKAPTGESIYFPWCMGIFAGQEVISPDGSTVVQRGWGDNSLVQIAPAPWGNQISRQLTGHRGHVSAAAFSPGGRYLATGGFDSTILIWDLHQAESLHSPQEEPARKSAVFPEAPADIRPLIELSFENQIGSPPLAATCLDVSPDWQRFVPGYRDLALEINTGTHRKIQLDEGSDINLPDGWTLQFWFRIVPQPEETSFPYLELVDCDLLSMVIYSDRRATVFYRFPNRGGHGSISLTGKNKVEEGIWNHVAVSWEGPGGYLRVHFNGEQIREIQQSGLATVLGPLTLGYGRGTKPGRAVQLDDLRIYARARRPEEILRELHFAENPWQK